MPMERYMCLREAQHVGCSISPQAQGKKGFIQTPVPPAVVLRISLGMYVSCTAAGHTAVPRPAAMDYRSSFSSAVLHAGLFALSLPLPLSSYGGVFSAKVGSFCQLQGVESTLWVST